MLAALAVLTTTHLAAHLLGRHRRGVGAPVGVALEDQLQPVPGAALPGQPYPEGAERAAWHLRDGRARFEAVFGLHPRGCWPSEAAVCERTAKLLDAEDFEWFATSQSVQNATLHRHGETSAGGYASAYRVRGNRMTCFFRDDGLSDRVGFVYKDWQPRDAVADLVQHLEQVATRRADRTVVLALDGENPWEHYPENGIQFVRGLYGTLSEHPRLRMVTFAQCLDEGIGKTCPELPTLVAGSWVHGQLLTWIGHAEKNRAWELLIEAKRRYDTKLNHSESARHALGACEASDWFWWPGANNPAAPVADFDRMFRAHLTNLYRELGEPAPAVLGRPFATSGIGAALGAMLPGSQEK